MYARPQNTFMRHVVGGSAVMRRCTACVAWTAAQASFPVLRPAITVGARRCHTLTDTQSAQSGTSSDATCSPGHPPQPQLLLAGIEAVTRTVLELWPLVCSEATGTYGTFACRHITPVDIEALEERVCRTMRLRDITFCASFVAELQKGVSKFDKSKGGLSLIRKESSGAALTTAFVEGVLIVFMHPSVAAVDPSRAPPIQSIPTPLPPPGGSAQPPWRIYGIPDLKANQQNVIKALQFALFGGHESPKKLIAKFPDKRKLDVWAVDGQSMITRVHVATGARDWDVFMRRHCDFPHNNKELGANSSPTLKPIFYDTAVAPETPPSLRKQTPLPVPLKRKHVNVAGNKPTTPTKRSHSPILFHVDELMVQLFGGESGIGKTTVMLVGRSAAVDLVVYVIAAPIREVVQWNENFKRLEVSGLIGELNDERRSLIKCLADSVKHAVGQELHESLCAYEGAFRVRLVFDEVGSLAEVVRALCSEGTDAFREVLKWSPGVSMHIVAGGTGVGAADVPCSSQFKNYFLTRLQPESSGVLWERMKESVTKKAKSRETSFRTTLENVLLKVDADAMCQSVRDNPRLAALMIVRCWNVASLNASTHLVKQINSADIRYRILMPVAERFRSLNGLKGIRGGHAEFRDVLVSALGYALFRGFRDPHPDRGRLLLSQIYGVLVDNTYFKARIKCQKLAASKSQLETVKPQLETVKPPLEPFNPHLESLVLDDNGCEVANPSTLEIACYPTAKGHYSISPAMVVVLNLLLVGNSEQFVKCEGDKFEVALAHMLYIAVQVFQGRPVVELLQFVFGRKTVSESVIRSLKEKAVTYTTVDLRYNRTLVNMDVVVPLVVKAAESPKNDTLVKKNTKNSPLAPFNNMWNGEDHTTAFIEVSPGKLPSADVVLHIPGVLTLPIQCKDRGKAVSKGVVEEELDGMVRRVKKRVEKTTGQQASKKAPQSVRDLIFVDKLAKLGGVVVPVLCYSRSVLNADHHNLTSEHHDFDRVIFADGLGEDVPKGKVPCRLDETRLVRRSMFPFTLEELEYEGEVTVIDSSPTRNPPATYVPPSYHAERFDA